MLLLEIDHLSEFHIDKFTIVTLIISLLLRPKLGVSGEIFYSGLVRIYGLVIIICLLVKRPPLIKTNIRWSLAGIFIGIVFIVIIALLELYLRPKWLILDPLKNSIAPIVFGTIFREFSNGVPQEEILFRGFLWGYLKRNDWEERKAIWLQGLLFWLIHFNRIFTQPFTFFLVIPLLTFILSKLTSRTKQLFPSIIVHTLVNTAAIIFNLATF